MRASGSSEESVAEYTSQVMRGTTTSLVRVGLVVTWVVLSGLGDSLVAEEVADEALGKQVADEALGTQWVHIRPDPEGTPTRIEIGVYFLDVMVIDDADQTFQVDLVFSARWRDSRLAFSAEETGLDEMVLPLQDVWYVGLASLNRREAEAFLPDVVRVRPDGEVTYSQRVQGILASPLDLHEFPFDSQVLPMHLVAYRHGPEEIDFVLSSEYTGSRGDFSVTGWVIEEGEHEVAPVSLPGLEEQHAGASFYLVATRQSSYFGLTMMVPLVLIVLMAWTVFWIDPSVVPPQVGIATAAVFSLIAFRFSMRSALPAVAYMTRADQFLLGATLLVFGALGEVIVTARLSRQGREEQANRVDRWGRWIFIVAFVLLAVFTLWL